MKAAQQALEDGSSASIQTLPLSKELRGKESPFYVPSVVDFFGGLVERYRDFWLWLGRLESSLLSNELSRVRVRMPIYISGLARSGSTLLHEVISSHLAVATHRIKDFPMVFTPYWWRRASVHIKPQAPRERTHQDKMMVTTESPDAIEEMLWMAFFPKCRDPSVSSLMGSADRFPAFESFYRSHIGKLLLAEGATRYAAKANYHVARLPYLVRLFPDAKFLIPVRGPAGHIASLMRQHQWFSVGQRKNRRSMALMRRSGHFEFGLDRRPMNLGDGERVRRILQAWAVGDEVRGQALYWDMVYGHLARLLDADAQVREAALVVRFESICDSPAETLRAVLAHCQLPNAEPIVEQFAPRIRFPTYYQSSFSPEELAVIREETAVTSGLWGYQ